MQTLTAGFSGDAFPRPGEAPGRHPEHGHPIRWALVARARSAVRSGAFDRPGLAEEALARALKPEVSRTRVPGLLASPGRSSQSRGRGPRSLG